MERLVYAAGREGCGLASLKMLLVHYQKSPLYARLSDREGKRDLEELRILAEREGVRLIWKKVDMKEKLMRNRRFPLLLLLEIGSNSHLVYLQGKRGRKFIVYDPRDGKKALTYEEIYLTWTGIYAEGELVERKRPVTRPKARLPAGYLAASLMQAWAAAASLVAAFYFFQNGASPFMPIAFFALFGVLTALGSFVASKGMSSFDARYLDRVAGKDLKDPSPTEKYAHYHTYKRLLFERARLLTEGFATSFPLLFLLSYNSPAFLFAALFFLLFLVLSHLFWKKPWKKEADALERREAGYLAGPPQSVAKEKATNRALAFEATRLMNRWGYLRAFEMGAVLLLAFVPSLLENRIEANFYLLAFFGLLALRDSFGALEKVLLDRDRFMRERAYFEANFGDA